MLGHASLAHASLADLAKRRQSPLLALLAKKGLDKPLLAWAARAGA